MSAAQNVFFFFNDAPTTEIYTLSLHDALPISEHLGRRTVPQTHAAVEIEDHQCCRRGFERSEEHTSELQSQSNLVCRLLLEKKKETSIISFTNSHRIVTTFTLCA